jgi:mannose-1-phosphate guanylyltransferase
MEVYEAASFKEKPDDERAEQMVSAGSFDWNSGMFVWKVEHILAEIDRQMPDLAAKLKEIESEWNTRNCKKVIEIVWPTIENQTIDYGVMEGAQKVAVIPASGLGWSDVGSWDSLFEVLPGDKNGNIVMGGEYVGMDTNSSLIYVNQPHRLIVTIGIEDLIVVDTGDVLLVCRKDQAQKVRQVVSQLQINGQSYI